MTIILQPETICFLGNLNDIVLGDIAGEISFTLKLGNAILVDERYWPENGKVRIRIKVEKPREFDPFGQTGLPPLATI